MATAKDWLEKNHFKFFNQVSKTVNYLMTPANRTRMGLGENTPLGVYYDTVFVPLHADYLQKYVLWNDPATRTPDITRDSTNAEEALQKEYRKMYTALLKSNPLVTDHDLIDMELPPHSSGERHPVPPPTTYVQARAVPVGAGVINMHFTDAGSEGIGKPFGVHGVEILSAIRDTPTTDWNDLTHSSFGTHTPYRMTFEGPDRGKTLYFSLRWENTIGEKGPLSPIQSVIIP
jgi:hypothetical protein